MIRVFNFCSSEDFNLFFLKSNNGGVFGFLNPFSSLVAPYENILYGIDSFYLAKFFLNVKNISFDNSSFAPILLNFCLTNNKSILFIGASEIENKNFIFHIKSKYKNLNCTGLNGYLDFNFYDIFLNNNKFDIIVLGLGSPLQENMALKLFNKHKNIKFITCGGYIRQASNGLNYFPNYINLLRIRFLYRFFKEPHVFKRTLINYSIFIFKYTYGNIKFNRVRK